MKKSLTILLLVFIPFIAYAAKKEPVGLLKDVKGDISTRISFKKSEPAKDGMKVYEGMKIKVKEGASLKIVFNDKSEVQLGPNTLFRVKKKSQDSKDTNIELFQGLARVKAHDLKKKDTFLIKTPSAVAGVRGTFFDTRVSRNAAINVKCYSTAGQGVVVQTPTGSRTVGAGFSCVATSTGSIKMKKMSRGVMVKTKTGGQKKTTKKSDGKKGTTVKTKTVDAKEKKDGNSSSNSNEDSGSETTSESDSATETTETVEPPPIGGDSDLGDDFGGDDFDIDTSVDITDTGSDISEIANEINDEISTSVQEDADKDIVNEAIQDNLRTLKIQFRIEDK
jgi:hypothetical protein